MGAREMRDKFMALANRSLHCWPTITLAQEHRDMELSLPVDMCFTHGHKLTYDRLARLTRPSARRADLRFLEGVSHYRENCLSGQAIPAAQLALSGSQRFWQQSGEGD